MQPKYLIRGVLLILFGSLVGLGMGQNPSEEKQKPNQLDVIKVNVLQLAVNEARFLYEMELRPLHSLEFGLGFIYPNPTWFEQGETPLLATGGGIYASYRKYRIPKRYFTTPFFSSYFSPLLFYRYSAYENEWLLFEGPTPETSECAQFSEYFHQLGLVIRLGGQTTQGRVVMDIYGGLGLKYIPSTLTRHAFNAETNVCEILPTSNLDEVVTPIRDFQVIVNAGLKIGIRRSNRERNYEDRGIDTPDPQEDTPPQYAP